MILQFLHEASLIQEYSKAAFKAAFFWYLLNEVHVVENTIFAI